MRERPIIMSAPMVRAILGGTKSMTRRVVKLPAGARDVRYYAPPGGVPLHGWADPGVNYWTHDGNQYDDYTGAPVLSNNIDPCPYGVPGDRLWVRETHLYVGPGSGSDLPSYIEERKDPANHKRENVWYRADRADHESYRWTPSIHMPRWASRITLEITGVRVERLNDISEDDAIAEGVDAISLRDMPRQATRSRRADFAQIWGKIHGADSWAANPWVWCISFRRVA